MAERRFIIEMGMGIDAETADYQKAAAQAIGDATGHAALLLFANAGIDPAQMRVAVTVGVQAPEALDCAALAGLLPQGQVTVRAVFGGQDVTDPDSGHRTVVATAAVEAFLPEQGDGWRGGAG